MPNKIICSKTDAGKQYIIQPNDINTDVNFWNSFGNSETETSARIIVILCQKKGGWFPFKREELSELSNGFKFNKLSSYNRPEDDRNYIILGNDGYYYVTHEFIATCFKSAPAF